MKRLAVQVSGSSQTLHFRLHPQSLELSSSPRASEQRRPASGESRGRSLAQRPRPTHFLSFPLRDPIFIKRVDFIQKTLSEHSKDVPPKAFVRLEKLHLTLAVMTLEDEDAIQRASEIFSSMDSSQSIVLS